MNGGGFREAFKCLLGKGQGKQDRSCSQRETCTGVRSCFLWLGCVFALSGEHTLSRFKCRCSEPIERQKLKAEERDHGTNISQTLVMGSGLI